MTARKDSLEVNRGEQNSSYKLSSAFPGKNILQDLQDLQCKVLALFLQETCTNLASLQEFCTENVPFLARILHSNLACKNLARNVHKFCKYLANQESCTENVPFLARILETLQDMFPWVVSLGLRQFYTNNVWNVTKKINSIAMTTVRLYIYKLASFNQIMHHEGE